MGRGVIIALAIGLFVSLGVNVFTLGHMSGRMIAGHPTHEKHERGVRGVRGGFEDPFKIMRYAEELSPELRERFREAFREELPALRAEYHVIGGLRRELGVLMSAEDWDSDAIAAKLDEIDAARDRQHELFNRAFLGAFESLPAAERKRLIDTANERRAAHKKKRKRDRDGSAEKPDAENK